jgi:hypothetical protein
MSLQLVFFLRLVCHVNTSPVVIFYLSAAPAP